MRVPLLSATFPVATVTAPLGVAANDAFALVAFQTNSQGVYLVPLARDGGWQPTVRVSTAGELPAVAADRSGFLVAWIEADQLKVAPVTCQ